MNVHLLMHSLIIADEGYQNPGEPALYRIKWNGTSFVYYQLASTDDIGNAGGYGIEQINFVPAGLGSVAGSGTVQLAGAVSDDGELLPSTSNWWSQVSGPASASFDNYNLTNTIVRFTQVGDYTLQLSAFDGEFTTSTNVIIHVVRNQAPFAYAGTNIYTTNASVTLFGSNWDDGLPYGKTNILWTQLSSVNGTTAQISNANTVFPTIFFPEYGADTYVFRLTVDDGQATNWSDVTVSTETFNVSIDPPYGYPTLINTTNTFTIKTFDQNGAGVDGSSITCYIEGANNQTLRGTTGTSGTVTFQYKGLNPGLDTYYIVAESPDSPTAYCSGSKGWALPLTCSLATNAELNDNISLSWPDGKHWANFYLVYLNSNVLFNVNYSNENNTVLVLRDPKETVVATNVNGSMEYMPQVSGFYLVEMANTVAGAAPEYTLALDCSDGFYGEPIIHVLVDGGVANSGDTINIDTSPTNAPQYKTLTVQNVGTTALIIGNITTTGAFSPSVTNMYLSPGASNSVVVAFTNASDGVTPGSIVFQHNAIGSPTVIYLEVNAFDPIMEVEDSFGTISNASLELFPVTTSGAATNLTFTIWNNGYGDLIVSNILLTGAFVNDSAMFFDLSHDNNTNVTIGFTSPSNGLFLGQLTWEDNAVGQVFKIYLAAIANAATNGPTISIYSPWSESILYDAPTEVDINSSATDAAYVQYYASGSNGIVLLGCLTNTLNSNPYNSTFPWTNVSSGNYMLTAVAVNSAGLMGIAAPVSISVLTGGMASLTDIAVPVDENSVSNLIDPDINGNNIPYTITGVGAPLYGTASLDTNLNIIFYTPPSGVYGSDQFTFTGKDAAGSYATANVFVTIVSLLDVVGQPQIGVLTNGANVPSGSTLVFASTVSNVPTSLWLTVTNAGTKDLLISGVDLLGDFTNLTGTNFDIPANGSTNLQIDFNASSNEICTGEILITNNANAEIYWLYLTGTALPQGRAPQISITAPLNGLTNLAPANIGLAASVAPGTAAISYVEFDAVASLGNVSFGQVSNSPYVLTAANLPSGDYSITATAVALDGRAATSTPVTIHLLNPLSTNGISFQSNNPAPIAVNQAFTVLANSVNNVFHPLLGDTNSGGGPLTIVSVGSTGGGTATIFNKGQDILYSALPGYQSETINGSLQPADGFSYTIANAAGETATADIAVIYSAEGIPLPSIFSPSTGATVSAGAIVPLIASVIPSQYVTKVDFYQGQVLLGEVTNGSGGYFTNYWQAVYNPCGCGFTAQATDSFGQVGTSPEIHIIVNTSGLSGSVVAVLTNLVDTNGILPLTNGVTIRDGVFNLYGEAYHTLGSNVTWQLGVYTQDGTTLLRNLTPTNTSAVGSATTSNLLTRCDLTTLINGVYDLKFTVTGGFQTVSTDTQFALESNLKIGQFSFSQNDLIIPVHGIPLTVIRTYNSINPDKGDFGYSWTYALNSMDVALDETRQNVEDLSGNPGDTGVNPDGTFSLRTAGGYDVTLDLPSGQRTTFSFYLAPVGDYEYQASWRAAPGVTATLTAQGDSIYYNDPGYGSGWAGGVPLNNWDFPGYILQTLDGTKYVINRQYMGTHSDSVGDDWFVDTYGPPYLAEIDEPNGDTIAITTNAITYNAGQPSQKQIQLNRNAEGLITSITDPNGTSGSPPALVYDYDAQDNLIDARSLVDRTANGGLGSYVTNSYSYTNLNFPHFITSIQNANGVQVARNFYDSTGKLIAVMDADGNETQFIHNQSNSVEIVIDRLGHTNSMGYDLLGNVLAKTNALGQITLMSYDVNNNQTNQVTYLNGTPYATNNSVYNTNLNLPLVTYDALGNSNVVAYDGNGNPTTSTDANGNTTTNYYDLTTDELRGTSDALGHLTTNYYSTAGLLLSSVDALGNQTLNAYDQYQNLTATATVDTNGVILSTNTFSYDANGNRTNSTVWRHVLGASGWVAATTISIFDAKNRLIQTIDPNGGTNTTVYNATGQQAATIDALGNTTSYFYDDQSRLTNTTYADQTVESSAYDANGNRISSVDRLGRVTTYVYDALNRLVETIYPDNTSNSTFYDGVGRVQYTVDALGITNATGYDVAGRQIGMTNGWLASVSNVMTYVYDANGNRIYTVDGLNHTNTAIYDALNRMVTNQFQDGSFQTTRYDSAGRKIAQTDQATNTTWFGYDGGGRLTSVTNALMQVTRYAYDEAGNQTNQVDALNHTTTYFYDALGRRVQRVLPGGQSETFGYDAAGNAVSHADFNGLTLTNQYDVMNRLLGKYQGGIKLEGYAYDANGALTCRTDAGGTYAWVYDVRGRLATNLTPVGTLFYQYDANGNETSLTSATTGGVSIVYEYDALSRLTNVIDHGLSGTKNTAYTYDRIGNLQTLQYPNGVTNLWQYDSLNRLTNLVSKLNSTALGSFFYQLGPTGNRTNLAESINATVARNYAWAYDPLYRLTNETISTTAPAGSIGYAYDAVGNRTNRTSTVSGLTNQAPTYGTNDWLDADTYDSNGNTTLSSSVTYQYDYANRLTNNGTVTMVYAADGNRIAKTSGSTTTLYLVASVNPTGYPQVVEESTVSGGTTNLSRVYTHGLSLISQRSSSATYFFGLDGHGSTRFLTDGSGSFVNGFAYDAYGNLIASNTPPQTSCLYSGEQWDADLDQYYLRARYYKPDTGRFWTMDTYEGDNEDPLSLHKYLYCQGNPVDHIDPSGNDLGDVILSASIQVSLGAQVVAPIATSAAFAFGTIYIVSSVAIGVDENVFHSHTEFLYDLRDQSGNLFFIASLTADVATSLTVPSGGPTRQPVKTIQVSKSRYPQSAQHIEDAQAAGKPMILTVSRSTAVQNRAAALGNSPIVPGLDRDEYPPAVFSEGGQGSSVTPINPSDNRGSGASIGYQLRGLPDGTTVKIEVVDDTKK